MSNKKIKQRIKKILENKNSCYKKKYFMLSKVAETKIIHNEKLFEEFVCYVKSLNVSNGSLPREDSIVNLYESQLKSECVDNASVAVCKSRLLKETKMFYTENITNTDDVVNSLLESVDFNQIKVDAKLAQTIIEAATRRIRMLSESEYKESNVVDLSKLFDATPLPQDLARISSGEDEDLESMYTDDEDFDMGDDEQVDEPVSKDKIEKTVNRILNIFTPIVGGDPKKISKKDLAAELGYKGNGRYVVGQKKPVLTGWDKVALSIGKMMSPYGRSKGMSTVAQRKFWIIQCIKFCLLVESQTGVFLGLSDAEKSRLSLSSEELNATSDVVSGKRRSGMPLSRTDIARLVDKLHEVLLQGDYNLESASISEGALFRILDSASTRRSERSRQFRKDLDIMYPLHDTRSEDDKVMVQSKEEREATQSEVDQFFLDQESEVKDMYGDEIDPDSGEPLYADTKQIDRIKRDKKVDLPSALEGVRSQPAEEMTVKDFVAHRKEIDKDFVRLKQLEDKVFKSKPDIFASFEEDSLGNIDYTSSENLDLPEDILTPKETEEYYSLISKIESSKNITVLGLDRRASIYDELYERGATPEEFLSFMKSFGLIDKDKPSSYRDVSRSSYGKFRDSAGARQYSLKAWFKANYYSLSPKEKAEIYSQLGEKWFERLVVNDLVTDDAFIRQGDKASPKLSRYFEKLPRFLTPKTIERYFDIGSDESLDTVTQEKLNQVMSYASSSEEYDSLLSKLQDDDPDFKKHAILDSLFEGNSSFRIFATTLLKEFYNKKVWSTLESDLAYSIKEYFEKNYRGAGIGASLSKGEKAKDVPREEGKDLFNPIIYLAMGRVGLPGEESYKSGDASTNSLENFQREYFLGIKNKKGDFASKVRAYNASIKTGGLYSVDSTFTNQISFGPKDTRKLLDDVFNPRGIIGKVRDNMRQLTRGTSNDFVTFLLDYDEGKLDMILVNSLAMSNVLKRGADSMNIEIFKAVAEDSEVALKKYKKEFGKSLVASEFVDEVIDDYGYDKVNLKSKLSAKGIASDMSWLWFENVFTRNYV